LYGQSNAFDWMRLGTSISISDDEDRRRGREERALRVGELALRAARQSLVRLVDPAGEGEVPEDTPEDEEEQDADDREHDPAPPAPRPSRPGLSRRGLDGGAFPLVERDPALDPAAAVSPVGLVSLGHPGRYRSPPSQEAEVAYGAAGKERVYVPSDTLHLYT
jgi:hypothetical protein